MLTLKNSTDRITVSSYFNQDAATIIVEEIRFVDGQVLNIDAVKALVQKGTTESDRLYGYAVADTLSGGLGSRLTLRLCRLMISQGDEGNDHYTVAPVTIPSSAVSAMTTCMAKPATMYTASTAAGAGHHSKQ
ncbi:calcium-binding protein [Pseudomonas aeruginosa]|nr:calcium-binding protein [Pseudomonas aeruginosa]